ncbi:MAG: transposase DNA-binding-containing protein, partial [Elainellaceae cyanobacterium]
MRHAKRLKAVLNTLAEQPTASVPEASSSASEAQNIYRFWSNTNVKPRAILASHRDGVVKRARECQTVLAVQDTTDLSYATRPGASGLGFTNQSNNLGIKV